MTLLLRMGALTKDGEGDDSRRHYYGQHTLSTAWALFIKLPAPMAGTSL
ncbi:hypothetical protein IAD21_05455 [Abditibacteriota bacterium]|nr:hypothetical protein IAD21_05455 [Abditibacteriota bacterium]